MREKIFFKLFLLVLIFLYVSIEARELSIKQIEERKKADQERLEVREKRGLKKFSKEIFLNTTIVFITKERKVLPVLSNLDPILDDEGFRVNG